jgi:hypothetical protein
MYVYNLSHTLSLSDTHNHTNTNTHTQTHARKHTQAFDSMRLDLSDEHAAALVSMTNPPGAPANYLEQARERGGWPTDCLFNSLRACVLVCP